MPKRNLYRVLENKPMSANTFRLRTERPNVPIKAGQCFNVGCGDIGINREYSMYSGGNDPYLDFLIREVESGLVSPLLRRQRAGDVVEINGPYGEFCLNEGGTTGKRYLFIATGTGVAPFHSFIRTFPGLNYTLVHGIRSASERYDFADYPNGRYVACISRPENGERPSRVTDYLRENPVAPGTICYLCGNRNMIIDVIDILRAQGVAGDNIVTEVFF